jgi:hypothetical protein
VTDESTRPAKLEGMGHLRSVAWQSDDSFWSFGPTDRHVIGRVGQPSIPPGLPNAKNLDGPLTRGPQKITAPKVEPPVVLRSRGFGRRRFPPLYHWEGVVDEVGEDSFTCHLIPLEGDGQNQARVEFSDFSFDDLGESDRALVRPGAVFYWTVGRLTNAAGTTSNQSLVRFRRIPAPTATQVAQAKAEAGELLRELE